MKGAIALRKPVPVIPTILDTSSTNVTSAAWVTFIASVSKAASGILLHNPGSQPIKIGIGAAAAETELGIVIPIGVSILIPVEIAKGARVSLRSMGATQSSGIITASLFQ